MSVPDVGKVARVVRAAERSRHVLPRGPKPLWVTEIDWDSSPPDGGAIPIARQAQYLSRAFYELWSEGVSRVLWYEVVDPGGPAGNNFTGGGLFFGSGRAKPAAAAFRFPFVALTAARGATTLWGRAPHPGQVVIEAQRHGHWRGVARATASRDRVFEIIRSLGAGVTLRGRQGRIVSLPARRR